ncbi:hypothetical protein IT568_07640 [bacterium]|nr:hypothetical protein [bacterium]
MEINLVVEDIVQLFVLEKILSTIDCGFLPQQKIINDGFGKIKKNLFSYNEASKITPYLILVDLDLKECPPTLIKEWITFERKPNFIFRVAVREVEAWLLADRRNFASFLGISEAKIDKKPETKLDSKGYLIELAKKGKRKIQEDLVPKGNAKLGKNYNFCLAEFITQKWNVENAMENSESLTKLVATLKNFKVK